MKKGEQLIATSNTMIQQAAEQSVRSAREDRVKQIDLLDQRCAHQLVVQFAANTVAEILIPKLEKLGLGVDQVHIWRQTVPNTATTAKMELNLGKLNGKFRFLKKPKSWDSAGQKQQMRSAKAKALDIEQALNCDLFRVDVNEYSLQAEPGDNNKSVLMDVWFQLGGE